MPTKTSFHFLAINLAFFSALSTLAHVSPTSTPLPFPTTLPSTDEWNHTPFNITEYLSDTQTHGHAQKRNTPSVYMCQNANWQWPCWWQPALSQCVNTGKHHYSLGPDGGVACVVYRYPTCGQGNGLEDVTQTHLVKPGKQDVWGLSWQCGTGYGAW